jgi:hypothetical protein
MSRDHEMDKVMERIIWTPTMMTRQNLQLIATIMMIYKELVHSSVTASNTGKKWTHCVNRPFCFNPCKESVVWKQRCWNQISNFTAYFTTNHSARQHDVCFYFY